MPDRAKRSIHGCYGRGRRSLDRQARRRHHTAGDRPQEAFGRHGYDAAGFDLQPDQIAEQYKAYTERFDVPSEAG